MSRLAGRTENVELQLVQDHGVTDGKNCARWVSPKGAEYAILELEANAIRDWGAFEYLAIDVFTEDEHSYAFVGELWDQQSKNYATRCTWEETTTHQGRQTLLYPIHRARRNGKSALSWDQLEAKDKIDLNQLKRVKLFVVPRADRPAVFWIDNIRLLTEEAAKPKLRVPLPNGAYVFQAGTSETVSPGFLPISPNSRFTRDSAGFVGKTEITASGEGWPDPLSGSFLMAPEGQAWEFQAPVKSGTYEALVLAGPIHRTQPQCFEFVLHAGNVPLVEDKLTPQDYFSEKHFYRFLKTSYSPDPEKLWENYLARMYPAHTRRITVSDGLFKLRGVNYFLSAVILVPQSSSKDFPAFVAMVQQQRLNSFLATLPPATTPRSTPETTPYEVFIPYPGDEISPQKAPTKNGTPLQHLETKGVPGQRGAARFAILPNQDLGNCQVSVKSKLPALQALLKDTHVYFQNQRWDGKQLREMALIPTDTWNCEAGVNQTCWLWTQFPENLPAGTYQAEIVITPQTGVAKTIPWHIEVYPFTLETQLPVSYGFYYRPRREAGMPEDIQEKLQREQFEFMQQLGLTSTTVEPAVVLGLGKNDEVRLQFDPRLYRLAHAAGLAQHPDQPLMTSALSIGRGIGRRLLDSGLTVDRQPGIELRQPRFEAYFLNAARQYQKMLTDLKIPVAVEVVDEPRETPNPWNRNLADTITYAQLLKQAGIRTFITPMSDSNEGKDYTVLADYAEIMSVHAWPASQGLIDRTRLNGKTLWFYNSGADRFTWGAYPWRMGARGRWEWHFCWEEDQAVGGYPGREWFNPFVGSYGYAPQAPATYFGGLLFQSVLLDVAEGITDYRYLFTLEQRLARLPENHPEAKEARQWLEAIKQQIPKFPPVKGLEGADAGALVGQGTPGEFQRLSATWRDQAAEYLRKLSNP